MGGGEPKREDRCWALYSPATAETGRIRNKKARPQGKEGRFYKPRGRDSAPPKISNVRKVWGAMQTASSSRLLSEEKRVPLGVYFVSAVASLLRGKEGSYSIWFRK